MTLTRDEIMVMTPEQLRIAIAKAKGYRWYEIGLHSYLTTPDNALTLSKGSIEVDAPCDFDEQHLHLRCPNYPVDIAAAFPLFEEMAKVMIVRLSNGDGDSCDIDCFKFTELLRAGEYPFRIGLSEKTYSLAICRAWLIWKGEG